MPSLLFRTISAIDCAFHLTEEGGMNKRVAGMGDVRSAHEILIDKSEWSRLL
jgi:hypothetical protein